MLMYFFTKSKTKNIKQTTCPLKRTKKKELLARAHAHSHTHTHKHTHTHTHTHSGQFAP